MKKWISFAFAILLIMAMLVGCKGNYSDTVAETKESNSTREPVADVWDGTVADSFDSGDGSESSPYKIATAEQLALLASEINSGKTYTDKHFALIADIDLANLSWTPIGTNKSPFDGTFNGQGHAVSNMKIDTLSAGFSGGIEFGVAGLFGYTEDVHISDLSINNASVTVGEHRRYSTIRIGILAANIDVESDCDIHNIRVGNATVSTDKSDLPLTSYMNFYAGGIIGSCTVDEDAELNLSSVLSYIDVNMAGFSAKNYVGGIVGMFINKNTASMSDLCSYLSVQWHDAGNERAGANLAGAIGAIHSWDDTRTSITNMFSRVTSSKKTQGEIEASNYEDYYCVSVIGDISVNEGSDASLQLKNIFGCVDPSQENADFTETSYTLYTSFGGKAYPGTNCTGCDQLPAEHGFDTNIWDVSDPKKPTLKKMPL